MGDIETLAYKYLELKQTIDDAETQQGEIKKQIKESMTHDGPPTTGYTFPYAEVVTVKGRTTKKLDRLKLSKICLA